MYHKRRSACLIMPSGGATEMPSYPPMAGHVAKAHRALKF